MIKELISNYLSFIKYTKKDSLIAILAGILGAITETIAIYFLSEIIRDLEYLKINESINNGDFNFAKELIIFLFFSIISSFIFFISNKYLVICKSKLERNIRKDITKRILELEWPKFINLDQGEISKTIITEGEQISTGFMYFLSAIIFFSISATYFIICLFLVKNTFLLLIFYAFIAFRIYKFYSKKAHRLGKDLSLITSNIGKSSSSIFNNLKYIRSNGKEEIAMKDSNKIFKEFADYYEKSMTASYKSKQVTEILTAIFIFIAISYIFLYRQFNTDIILSLSLFIRLAPRIYNTQTRLLDATALISWPKKFKEDQIWAEKYKLKNKQNKLKINSKETNIFFKSVWYKYPNSEEWIIKDLNFTINKNEFIGISGKSGSGKTTLLDLITGLIIPTKGNIFISNNNLKNIELNNWRELLGIVFQESYLINDTIAANIGLGEKKINLDKVKESLIKANAYKFVNKLPNGINEYILDRGSRFSGGERQRLALARALYKNPKILIMDEPTSALDKNAEEIFIKSLKALQGSITVIIISHKDSILNSCDKVLKISRKIIDIKKFNK
tara:strand:+ start:41559 stop:43244 length:1686 start_codon:yes stop_codon:yes gene_type:complete